MKVVHLSTNDIKGGAARAAYRIHSALKLVMDSRMIVNNKYSGDETVLQPRSSTEKLLVKLGSKLDYASGKMISGNKNLLFSNAMFSPNSKFSRISEIGPDIVNLHWINDGFVTIKDLERFDSPLVWTVHDMWPFTGGCHYSGTCENYKSKCQRCPALGSKSLYDLSSFIFNRKKKIKKEIVFVAPSQWIGRCISQSALFDNSRVHTIPYPIDLTLFKPGNKNSLRELLGLPHDKKLILFGADNAVHDERKGFSYLVSAINELRKNSQGDSGIECIVFGSTSASVEALPFPVRSVGTISDDLTLAAVYGACDVFVAPSVQDNLPNTVIESLACGVPVVAFNIGGMPDMIDHGSTGYLATPFVPNSLAEGIAAMLEHDPATLALSARAKAVEMFSPDKIAGQYKSLYENLLRK